REEFLALNPAGEAPVLVHTSGSVVAESGAICEYLEETCPEPALIGESALERAETRRLVAWFDGKFQREVTANITEEKMMKRMLRGGSPDSQALRAGYANLQTHLAYITWLTDRRNWLAGDQFSLADIAAAAHLSALDYLGDVPWDDHEAVKTWYSRVKSRPSFRIILADHIPGLPPPPHYANLDF
ncbi:MAG: glutathione S-transferase family protein, partial [Alphaproteobacteria bacterium]